VHQLDFPALVARLNEKSFIRVESGVCSYEGVSVAR
jgi:hypothetical protein